MDSTPSYNRFVRQSGSSYQRFLKELFCSGSFSELFRDFHQRTGWKLRHYEANLQTGQPVDGRTDPVIHLTRGVPKEVDFPSQLSPEQVREWAIEEEEWFPISVPDDFLPEDCHPWSCGGVSPVSFLRLTKSPSPCREPLSFAEARSSAVVIADIITEMQTYRARLWYRELEILSSEIYNSSRAFERGNFPKRFRELLQYMLDVLQFDAVEIYTLDDQGKNLAWRTGVGVSLDEMLHVSRDLASSRADSMALNEEVIIFDSKNNTLPNMCCPPQPFPTAICLPLMTNRTKFGTIWFYSNQTKVLADFHVQFAELMADHIALDYEQEMFFLQYGYVQEYFDEIQEIAQQQHTRVPSKIWWSSDLDISGWTNPTRTCKKPGKKISPLSTEYRCSGDYFDCFPLPENRTLVVLGNAGKTGLSGSCLISQVQTALRAHAQYEHSPVQLLRGVHNTLRGLSDSAISLFCGVLEPSQNGVRILRYAQVGIFQAIHLTTDRKSNVLFLHSEPEKTEYLGGEADCTIIEKEISLRKDESLIVINPGKMSTESNDWKIKVKNGLSSHKPAGAFLQASLVKNALIYQNPEGPQDLDRSVLVVRYTDKSEPCKNPQ